MTSTWTHKFSYPVPADPERVFRAVTDADELERWFAEHAVVDLAEGGDYRFWGRHTVGTPSEGEAAGELRSFEKGRRIEYTWTVVGVPSRVELSLEPAERDGMRMTRVYVRHRLEREPEGPRGRELIDDWWRFAVGNLAAYLSDPETVMRPDFSDPSPEIHLTLRMEASPETVWRALIEPEQLNKWFAKDAKIEPRVGGRYDPGWAEASDIPHDGPEMTILELETERRLTISWPDWRGDASVPPQRVTWELELDGDGTRVTLHHTGFVRTVDLSDYPFGWRHFMSQLGGVATGQSGAA